MFDRHALPPRATSYPSRIAAETLGYAYQLQSVSLA